MNNNCPSFRIIYLRAAEIYHAKYIAHKDLVIKNTNDAFNRHYSDVLTFNLDLLFLLEYENKFNLEDNTLKSKSIHGEYYTDDFVNVSFEYSLRMNEKQEMAFNKEEYFGDAITPATMREAIYRDGFVLNGKEYVRYKRSAGAAKSATCLFIKKSLLNIMNSWSRAGLNESKDLCLENLTSYEAYKALSLSSLIKTFELNPYNILFVKDFKWILKDEEVVKVEYKAKEGLVASRGKCDIKDVNIFDGEGLMDVSVFEECDYTANHNKGMMLLRNRFFKCCAFNTNLQKWFKQNGIKDISQLNGYTFANRVEDIVLVVSESCLKYLKMTAGGFTKENIKRWCDAIAGKDRLSTFGVVKTDKDTRFFNGDMVETTYQLLNTLCLKKEKDLRQLLFPYFEYIGKVRNIKEKPEYVKLFLEGVVKEGQLQESIEEDYEDDSEDDAINGEELDYSPYTFKNKVCYEMLDQCKDFVNTKIFRDHLYENIIDSFRYKLYSGRILIDGTYATLFGNPLEFLKYTIKKDNVSLLEAEGVTSSMGKDEIYCSFFKEGEELVGSRAPHMTMGNILCAKNKKPEGLNTWFNLTRNIVVVDAFNNNIQQRLNGADYDSDSMLLTNNSVVVESAKQNYDRFPVPYSAFGPRTSDKKSTREKEKSLIDRIIELDKKIANNRVGMIVNLSQKLNSHLWNNISKNGKPKRGFNEKELYDYICILAVLAGAEIDSAKKSFDFTTLGVYKKVLKYVKANGFDEKPVFFFNVSPEGKDKPHASAIKKHVLNLLDSEDYKKDRKPFFNTTMDRLWIWATIADANESSRHNGKRIDVFTLIKRRITTAGLSSKNYGFIDSAFDSLVAAKKTFAFRRMSKKSSKSYIVKKKQFNDRIEACYKYIKKGINNPKKARKLISKIETEVQGDPRNTLLFVLLYIISAKEKELGYSYKDLFKNDGGIKGLVRCKSKTSEYVLFDRYHFKVASENK